MDIAALSIAMNQAQLMQNVSLAVTGMAMEQQQGNAEQLTEMMAEATPAPHPTLGQSIDLSI